MRAGAQGLSLLSNPLNFHLLAALSKGPRPLLDLRRAAGAPPQSTTRRQLDTLIEHAVVDRRRLPAYPLAVEYELSRAGRALVAVSRVLEAWLAGAPGGALGAGTAAARSAIRALVEGWSAAIVRALAAGPFSLTELSRMISALNYPSLARRLEAMHLAGLIERRPGRGRSHRYAATPWLRLAMAPLIASAEWERGTAAVGSVPIGRIDVESSLLLALPVARLPVELAGSVRIAVDLGGGGRDGIPLAGVVTSIETGQVVACATRLDRPASAWASGSLPAWLRAATAGDLRSLEIGGNAGLAIALLDRLRASHTRALPTVAALSNSRRL